MLLNAASAEADTTFKDFNKKITWSLWLTRPPKGPSQLQVLDYCHVNDPSAGSPTETLLRLLLPLNDKVKATSGGITARVSPDSYMPPSEDFTGSFNR